MIWQLIALGVALGLNNAMASVAIGAIKMKRRQQLLTALVFAVFEALMPLLGVVLGQGLAQFLGGRARFIGIGVLVVAGLYSIFKGTDAPSDEVRRIGMKTLFLAMALSLDNLSVGFGLGMLHVPVGAAAVTFGVISLAMTLAGLELGRFLGSRVNVSADKLSGAVLLVTAGVMFFK